MGSVCFKCKHERQGILSNYVISSTCTYIFLDGAQKTELQLQKSNPEYDILFEKLKQLKGCVCNITFCAEGTLILEDTEYNVYNIEKIKENKYTGTIMHVVGLSKETDKSMFYEVIFKEQKYKHIFIIKEDKYSENLDIIMKNNTCNITYKHYDKEYYTIEKIKKIDTICDSNNYVKLNS